MNRVSAAAAFNNATHSQSQDPSSFSIPRVSTNESSSSTAATTSAFPQQQQQISKVSTGAGHGIGGAVHPPSQPTAIPALTSNRPHERLSDSLSRPQNQTDENKFQVGAIPVLTMMQVKWNIPIIFENTLFHS